ncbi:unnamed protein product [Trichobilharzia regenti]|nr:unnamed protein product [Trichobilharzia regenti]
MSTRAVHNQHLSWIYTGNYSSKFVDFLNEMDTNSTETIPGPKEKHCNNNWMSSHFGHINSSGFQNKLYPYNNSNNNNNSVAGAPPRVPHVPGTNCSTSCTSVNCSPSIKLPPSSNY